MKKTDLSVCLCLSSRLGFRADAALVRFPDFAYLCGMFKTMLIVGSGSFAGGALRYFLSTVIKEAGNGSFPWGTLAVNGVGCFLIGLLYGLFARFSSADSTACLLLTTGFCGGFTTFSTFANESLKLLQDGNYWAFAAYVAASVCLGIGLTALAYVLVK